MWFLFIYSKLVNNKIVIVNGRKNDILEVIMV